MVPLSDVCENRGLVLCALGAVMLGLLGIALSDSAVTFMVASFVVGVFSVATQILVPFASHLAPETSRGKVVGTVMSGLLGGIMLARPFSSLYRRHTGLACRVLYIGRHDAGAADGVAARAAATSPQLHAELFADPAFASRPGSTHAAAAAPCFLSGNAVRGLQSFLDGIAVCCWPMNSAWAS